MPDDIAFGDDSDREVIAGDDHARMTVLFHDFDDAQQRGVRRSAYDGTRHQTFDQNIIHQGLIWV